MRREAAWLGELLRALPVDQLSPMLSVGSGTPAFRAAFQPWIETSVFRPLAERGVRVLHHELEPNEGIDISGDLGDDDVRRQLREAGVRSILCLNVFEHVLDRHGLADALLASLPPGGILVVTVPRRFPFHADPIDTLFRPSASDLAGLFEGGEVSDVGYVRCESLAAHWLSKPGKLAALRKARRGRQGPPPSPSGPSDPPAADARPSLASVVRMALVSTEITYAVVRRSAPGSPGGDAPGRDELVG